MKKVKSLLINILLLTGTSLLIRTVGISFTSYLSNKIGSAGIGLFQLIMSVYSLAITLATSGIKFTATRLVSEEIGAGSPRGAKKAVKTCLAYCLSFSLITALLLYFNAEMIGTAWLDDERTISSLRLLSVGLPFVAVSAVMNGYFTAVRKTAKSAVIQIADQFVMIIVTVMALSVLLPKGLEYGCLSLVAGSCISEVLSCLFLFLCYLRDKRRLKNNGKPAAGMFSRMFRIALPIAFSSYARSGLSTIQHLLIPRGLAKSGASKETAIASYGTVHGMVLPLLLYPSALLTTLAELLVPEFTECQVQDCKKRINYMATRVFKLSLLFSICIMGILFCFSSQLGHAIYKNGEVAGYLKIFAPLVLVMYMDTVVDGMLKGLGEQFNSMKYNVIDSFSCVLMVYFLLPALGIKGYIITVMVSEVLNFSLSLNRLIKITEIRLNLINSLLKPLFCIGLSMGTMTLLFRPDSLTGSFLPQNFVVQIVCFIGIYLVFLVLSSSLNKEDVQWLKGFVK